MKLPPQLLNVYFSDIQTEIILFSLVFALLLLICAIIVIIEMLKQNYSYHETVKPKHETKEKKARK